MIKKFSAVAVPLLLLPAGAMALSLPAMSPASAQSNSRICGNYWYADIPDASKSAPERHSRLQVASYMEVYKNDFLSCDAVLRKTDNNPVPDHFADWASYSWSDRKSVKNMECEKFTTDILLSTIKDSDGNPQPDVCQQMNKADTTAQVAAQDSHMNRMSYYFCPGKKYDATNDTCV